MACGGYARALRAKAVDTRAVTTCSVVPIVVMHRRRSGGNTWRKSECSHECGCRRGGKDDMWKVCTKVAGVVGRLARREYARGLRTKAVYTRAVTCSQRTSLLIGIAVSANDAPDADVLPST
jgi:hypothetical protein